MRKMVRAVLKFAVVAAVVSLAGKLATRAYEGEWSPEDDDFKLLALWGGRNLESESKSLRTGTASAVMGGIDIDLRGAKLDPGGAHVSLRAYMGGIRLLVPDAWRVYVEEDLRAGGIEVATAPPDELEADAPRLTVEAEACCGGVLITTED